MYMGSLSIRFNHLTKDLNYLTSALGVPCFRSWTVGAPRQTLKGEPLPGTYKDSYWYSELDFPSETGFKDQLVFAINLLVKAKETVHEIKASGGKVRLYLQLSGSINNGGTIESELLKSMAELGVDLEIEVFVGV